MRVEFEVSDAPPLPVEGGEYVFKFSSFGVLRTSSPEEYGWAKDHYFYCSEKGTRALRDTGWGAGGMIWGNISGESSSVQGKKKYEEFFVGTEKQFKEQTTGEPRGDAGAAKAPAR